MSRSTSPCWSCRSACSCRRHPRSETRAEAEAEVLRLVKEFLLERDRVVYADRPEGRYPLDAEAGRHAHQLAVEHADLGRIVGRAPQRTDVHEGLAEDADLLGQAERETELRRAGVIVLAAQRVGGVGIARADAADREAAKRVAADEEAVVEAQRRAAQRSDGADR